MFSVVSIDMTSLVVESGISFGGEGGVPTCSVGGGNGAGGSGGGLGSKTTLTTVLVFGVVLKDEDGVSSIAVVGLGSMTSVLVVHDVLKDEDGVSSIAVVGLGSMTSVLAVRND